MAVPEENNQPLLKEHSAEELGRILDALHRVHRLLGALTDLETLLSRIAEESRHVARAEASSVMLYEPASEELFFRVAIGESGDQDTLKRTVRLKLGQGIAGTTAQTRKSIVVHDAQQDGRFFAGADAAIQFKTRSLLAVPMIDRDTLVGVLEVVNKLGEETFSDLDVQVMEMFSALAATAVTNARLIEEKIRTERLALIGQAVTTLSHHTKNIVTGLSSSADLIDMGLKSGNIAVLNSGWPIFKRSTKRISNFVQDMLSFSKPRIPRREPCDPVTLIREAAETFSELFVKKQVELRMDTSGVTESAWLDAEALDRALLNLLINSAEAVPEGTGRIEISARTMQDGALEIIVSDNGMGIPEANRGKIFDPFFSTKGSQGTGLGLAVTRKIAEEHGGSVTVSDSPEGGALFRIVLPACVPNKEKSLET